MVSNILLAPVILGENISCFDISATFVIIGGSVLAVAFASHASPEYEYVAMMCGGVKTTV